MVSFSQRLNDLFGGQINGINELHLVTSVHSGLTAPVDRKPLSMESLSLRPGATAFNGVIMIESIGRDAL